MSILLFRDPGLEAVAAYLRERSVAHAVIDWDAFVEEGDLSIELDERGTRGVLRVAKDTIDLGSIRCVAYSTPPFASIAQHLGPDSDISQRLTHARWMYALHELHAAMPAASWVPGLPRACDRFTAQRKLAELALARQLGLHVPDTLCTTSPGEVAKFREKHDGKVLFREWAMPVVPLTDRKIVYFKTAMIDDTPETLERVAQSPTVFQHYLDKDYELRAMIVGDEVITVKIDSQASRRDKVDWRVYDLEHVSFHRYEVPTAVAQKLVVFARRVGIEFGSADLVRARNGQYYFLELNRPGAWEFFNTICDLKIEQRLGDLLIRKSHG